MGRKATPFAFGGLDGCENIIGRERDLLEAGAAEGVEKARDARRAALADVELVRNSLLALRRERLKNAPCGSAISTWGCGRSPSTVR